MPLSGTVESLGTPEYTAILTLLESFSAIATMLSTSLPLTSLLAFVWLYWDTRDTQQVTDLTYNTLLMILPSLTFFIFLPIALKLGMNFVPAITIAIIGTAIAYWCYTLILFKFFNISL